MATGAAVRTQAVNMDTLTPSGLTAPASCGCLTYSTNMPTYDRLLSASVSILAFSLYRIEVVVPDVVLEGGDRAPVTLP